MQTALAPDAGLLKLICSIFDEPIDDDVLFVLIGWTVMMPVPVERRLTSLGFVGFRGEVSSLEVGLAMIVKVLGAARRIEEATRANLFLMNFNVR